MFDFEYFNPKLGSVTVSIAEYGLTFSKAAVEIMGKPKYIMLAYDKNKNIVGIIPVDEFEEKKIEFVSKIKNGYVRINNKDFVRFLMRHFPDDPQMFNSKANRYFTYWDEIEKILVVDLNRPLDLQTEDEQEADEENSDAEKI